MSSVIKILLLVVATIFMNQVGFAQYKYKILVDNNQIWQNELPYTTKIKCDGVWSIPGNSAGNKGRDIPISEWLVGFELLGPGWVCTEDYWRNYPQKNYDLTKMIIGEDAIQMVCGYAEPTMDDDPHITTVINDDVIDNMHKISGKPVIVLSRAYRGKWINEVDRAIENSKVGGVCFEEKPDVDKYAQWEIINGIKAVLKADKKVFLLLPPRFTDDSQNYTSDIVRIFNYIKDNAPDVLMDENLNFVPNCYNRHKDKTTTMYGGDNSVEGAIKMLKKLRVNVTTGVSGDKVDTSDVY